MDFFGFDTSLTVLRKLARDADGAIADPAKYSIKIEHLRRRIESPDAIHLTLIASKLAQKITSQRNPEQPSPSLVQLLRYLSNLDAEFVSPTDATLEQNNQRWQELTAHLGEKCCEFHADALLLDQALCQKLGTEKFGFVVGFMFRHVDDLTLWVIAKKMDRVKTSASRHKTAVDALLTTEAQRRLTQTRHDIQKLYADSDPKTWAVGFYNLCGTLYGNCDRKLHSKKDLLRQNPSEIMDWVYGFGVIGDMNHPTDLKPSVRYQDQPRSSLQQTAREELRTWLRCQHAPHWHGQKPLRLVADTGLGHQATAPSWFPGWLLRLGRHIRAQ